MTPEEEQRAVGERIAEARREAGKTQRELAAELGVTVRSIQNYEAGVVVPYKHLRRIETLTHRQPGWLLSGAADGDVAQSVVHLQETLAQHQAILDEHLKMLRQQTELLRQQRVAGEERRQ
jgi:transcriptional regulator with XRE-family HTH domain